MSGSLFTEWGDRRPCIPEHSVLCYTFAFAISLHLCRLCNDTALGEQTALYMLSSCNFFPRCLCGKAEATL